MWPASQILSAVFKIPAQPPMLLTEYLLSVSRLNVEIFVKNALMSALGGESRAYFTLHTEI